MWERLVVWGCWTTAWVTRHCRVIRSLASPRASNLALDVWDTFGATWMAWPSHSQVGSFGHVFGREISQIMSDPFHFGSQTFCVELVFDSECRTYLDSVPPCSVHTVASICQSNKSVWEEIRGLRHVAAIVRTLTFTQSPSLVVLMFMCTDGQRSLQAHCSCTVATDRMNVNDVSCLPRPHGVLLQLGRFANGGQHLGGCEDGSRAEVGGEVVCSWVSE